MNKRLLTLSLAVLGGMLFTSCGEASSSSASSIQSSSEASSQTSEGTSEISSEVTSETSEASSEEPWYKKSERAMKNFGDKLAAGNYVLSVDGRLLVSVVSPDEIAFAFDEAVKQTNFAVMAVEGEAFQALIPGEDPLSSLAFLDKSDAMTQAEVRLPNFWFDDEGTKTTIWGLWHNQDQENPFHFTSNETLMRESIVSIGWFGDTILPTIQNMSLVLDGEDVNVATLSCTYRPAAQDVPLTMKINFGAALSDKRVKDWMNDPNRTYPDPISKQGKWPTSFQLLLQSALGVKENIEEVVPFIDFGSYACWNNTGAFGRQDKELAKVRDYHATEKNVEDYRALLMRNEYSTVTVDGQTHYRRILRARKDTRAYSDLTVEFDDGFYMTAEVFYDEKTYVGLDAINEVLVDTGFQALPATDVLSDWTATDVAFHAYEDKMCLFDFALYLRGTAKFTNGETATKYYNDYYSLLKAHGFGYDQADDAWTLDNIEGFWFFTFVLDKEAGILNFRCYREDYVDPTVAKAAVEAAGFPELDVSAVTSIRDTAAYYMEKAGMDQSLSYEMMFSFETAEKSSAFTSAYIQALLGAGFEAAGTSGGFDYYTKAATGQTVMVANSKSGFAGLNFFQNRA